MPCASSRRVLIRAAAVAAYMSPPEDSLRDAYRFFGARDFKKAEKAAEKARKDFTKQGLDARALEALRVMGDCALNARDLKTAKLYYDELMRESQKRAAAFFQAAASWGLGEVSSYRMDYATASSHFQSGLEQAKSIQDKWYMAWNSLGLGTTLRGLGKLDQAKSYLNTAMSLFREQNQDTYTGWAERALREIGGEISSKTPREAKIYLCPMCGGKYDLRKAELLSNGKMVTCDYCGTTVG